MEWMNTYFFLENGKVMFIENFLTHEKAKEHQLKYFPKATLAVRIP